MYFFLKVCSLHVFIRWSVALFFSSAVGLDTYIRQSCGNSAHLTGLCRRVFQLQSCRSTGMDQVNHSLKANPGVILSGSTDMEEIMLHPYGRFISRLPFVIRFVTAVNKRPMQMRFICI